MKQHNREEVVPWVRRAAFAGAGLLAVGLLVCLESPTQAAYYHGFVWDRSVDYDAGTTHGSTAGNPSTDAEGNPVWRMESTNAAGDGLGGPNPWYEGATQLQVWDSSWFGGGPVWARGDDVNPPIGSTNLTHNISNSGVYNNVPLIRWMNPLSFATKIDIAGDLTVLWRGGGGLSDNIDFDVVIVQRSGSTYNVLFGEVFEKPTDDQTWEELTKSVSLPGIWVQPGDEILIGHRGHSPATRAAWPNLQDNLTFEIAAIAVPEPTTMFVWLVLTFCASMGAGRWGRRRQLGGGGGGAMRNRALARVRRPWTPEQRRAMAHFIERGRVYPPQADWADAESPW
jgi:hypothetical protein